MAVCIINRVNSAPLQAQINNIASQINGTNGLVNTKQNKLVAGNGIVLNNNNNNTTTITNKFANYTGNLNDITYNYIGWATLDCLNKPINAKTDTETNSGGLFISCVNGKSGRDKYCYQVFVSVSEYSYGGGIYIRKYFGSDGWQPWTRLLQESNTKSGDNQDLNKFTFNYMGLLNTKNIQNSPNGAGGLLFSMANSPSANPSGDYRYVYQFFTPADNNKTLYIRKFYSAGAGISGGTWTDWSQLMVGDSKGYFTSAITFDSVAARFISSNINGLTNPSNATAGSGRVYFFDSKAADYNFDERTWIGAIRPYKWTSGYQGLVFNSYIPKKSGNGYVMGTDGKYENQNGYFLGAGINASGKMFVTVGSAKKEWNDALVMAPTIITDYTKIFSQTKFTDPNDDTKTSTGYVNPYVFTDNKPTSISLAIINNVAQLYMTWKTKYTFTGDAYGDLVDRLLGVLVAKYRPVVDTVGFGDGDNDAQGRSMYKLAASTGNVSLTAIGPAGNSSSSSAPNGVAFKLYATYILKDPVAALS